MTTTTKIKRPGPARGWSRVAKSPDAARRDSQVAQFIARQSTATARLKAIRRLRHFLTPSAYWRTLSGVWFDGKNTRHDRGHREAWRQLFGAATVSSELMMLEHERAYLRSIVKARGKVRLYQAVAIDDDPADLFAFYRQRSFAADRAQSMNGVVLVFEVRPRGILACFRRGGGTEVITLDAELVGCARP